MLNLPPNILPILQRKFWENLLQNHMKAPGNKRVMSIFVAKTRVHQNIINISDIYLLDKMLLYA